MDQTRLSSSVGGMHVFGRVTRKLKQSSKVAVTQSRREIKMQCFILEIGVKCAQLVEVDLHS